MLGPSDQRSPMAGPFPWAVGKALPDHVLVNNWQNGWRIPADMAPEQQTEYVLVFWPQYLEYIGLFSLILVFGVFIFPTKHAMRVKRHIFGQRQK